MLPPQLAATADGWEGVMYTAVQRLLQTLSGSPATVPLIMRGVRQKEQKHSDTDSTRAVGNLPERCVTECLVTSNNLTAPHAKVARHSQNTVSSESTQIWFPFNHSLTSSTEVLAKRLIGTCA